MPPAETVRIGGWVVALGRGAVSRLNSCTTFGESPRKLFEAIEAVERRYAGRGRESRFRLTHLDRRLDARLDTRGYSRSFEVRVMTGPVGGVTSPDVSVASAVTPGWLERYRTWGGHDEVRTAEIAESLGALRLPYGVFSSEAAIGVAVVDGDLVGLFDVVTDPEARRGGHARTLTAAMLGWAVDQGATRSYLQVVAGNEPAEALYEGSGFVESHRYWYRGEF